MRNAARPARAAAALALAASALTTGCGAATSAVGDLDSEARSRLQLSADATPAEIRAAAQELADEWYGTVAQRQAAEVLVAHELNGARSDCMADQGFDWSWAQGLMPAVAEDPLGGSVWFAEPHARLWSPAAQAWAPFRRSEGAMNADDSLSAAEIPDPGGRPTSAWEEFLAMEQSVAEADWACRSEIYAAGISSLVPVLDEFATRYQDQVDALHDYWTGVESKAEDLGWDPTTNTIA